MKQLSKRLGRTRQAVYDEAKRGSFKLRKLGNTVGLLNSELEAFLAALPEMKPSETESPRDAGRRQVSLLGERKYKMPVARLRIVALTAKGLKAAVLPSEVEIRLPRAWIRRLARYAAT